MRFELSPRAVAGALLALSVQLHVAAQRSASSVVSGHVFCQDTNGPARLARVMLTPLSAETNAPGSTTHLDGSYTIAEVPPGRYLVTAELPGYLSSFSFLDEQQRRHLRTLSRPPRGSVILDVANGQPATADLTLERGAAISGTILYDDGSPAIGMLVGVERTSTKGRWEPVVSQSTQAFNFFTTEPDPGVSTDSAGHFRLDGLPAGTYIVHAHLPQRTITVTMAENPALGVFDQPGEQLDVYSGDAFWKKQAKPVTVGQGDSAQVDLEVPVNRLLSLSGSVVAVSDGHPMSEGMVTLTPQDDPSDARTSVVNSDGRFHFLYVPAGDYVVKTAVSADGGRTFGPASVAVHVGDEAAVVTLSVPEGSSAAH